MNRFFLAALCVVVAVLGLVNPALAQAVADNTVDFSPILNEVIKIGGILATGVLMWAGVALKSWLASKSSLANSQLAESIQARYNEAAARAIAYAESKVKEAVPSGKVEIDNPFVRTAAEYLLKFWPDLTAKMDFEAISKTIIARLPSGPMTTKADAIAANAPVVATTPAPKEK